MQLGDQETFIVHSIKSVIALVLEEHVVSSQILNVPEVGSHGSCTIMALSVVCWVPE